MRSTNLIKRLMAITVALLVTGWLHATVDPTTAHPKFSIVPTSPHANVVNVLSNAITTVQYQVTNQTPVTRTLTMVPITGVNQSVTGTGSCANPFILASGQSCLLNLQLNGSELPKHTLGGPEVCKTLGPDNNNPSPFLCSEACGFNELNVSVIQPASPVYAYITQQDTTVIQCEVNTDGSYGLCTTLTDPTFNTTFGIVLNNTQTLAYIVNQNNTVSKCPINPTDGTFGSCTLVGSLYARPTGILLNSAGTIAYVVNSSNVNTGVTQCSILTDGSFAGCTLLTDPTFVEPFDIAINSATNTAYITNSSNTVSQCPIDPTTGSFLACTALPDATFQEPIGIAINNTGTTAYVVNINGPTVSQCTISPTDGSFTGCVTLMDDLFSFLNTPLGITLNQAGDTAYITVGYQNVVQCSITPTNSFGTCVSLFESSFTNGTFIAFSY